MSIKHNPTRVGVGVSVYIHPDSLRPNRVPLHKYTDVNYRAISSWFLLQTLPNYTQHAKGVLYVIHSIPHLLMISWVPYSSVLCGTDTMQYPTSVGDTNVILIFIRHFSYIPCDSTD